jgi:diguanylate cyclase (GGDEF)-like protein
MGSEVSDRPLEEQLRELTITHELIKTLTSTLELSEILRVVLDRLKTVTQAEALSLLLYDPDRDELVFAATETLRENTVVGLRIPRSKSLAGWVARTGESAVVNDVGQDPRFYPEIDRVSRFATRRLLSVPLRRAGKVLGVLEVANRYGGDFTDADRLRLEEVAAAAGDVIDPETLAHDTLAMRGLLARAVAAVPSEAASLLLLDKAGRQLVFRASRTLQPGVIDGTRLPCDRGIAGWVARHREPVLIEDVTKDPRHYGAVAEQAHFLPRAMICVPMVSKGKLLGVIQVINKIDGSAFTDAELRLSMTLADHAAIAIENASLYRQAYLASITDDLTGLGNTRHFNRVLPEMVEHSRPVSLIVLDLDNFKPVVDSHGHLAGSHTIAHIGRTIGEIIRPGDVAARFGGDEFVIALPKTDVAAAVEIAERVRVAIEQARTITEGDVDISGVTASLGVATCPDHAPEAEGLFRAADNAMYAVKRGKKNHVGLAGS